MTLDGQQIASLVGLLAVLAFWLVVLRRERGSIRAFRDWEARRKASKDAEDGVVTPSEPARPGEKRGPWG